MLSIIILSVVMLSVVAPLKANATICFKMSKKVWEKKSFYWIFEVLFSKFLIERRSGEIGNTLQGLLIWPETIKMGAAT